MRKTAAYLLILIAGLIVWRCASQTTPTGGPKDETPPQLKKSIPANKQTNFKGKVIELTFDELLKLNNPKEEIIITPNPGKDVLFTVKQNKVFIEPKTGWADTTTYSIAFREGIQDINEGNPAEDLHLAFSTGPTIDSLQINGRITESLTEKIPEKITVALYLQDTFDIFEHTASYITKTKEDGSFKIENLKSGNYFVYAFDDKNKNLKVDSKNEKFGFLPKPIPAVNLPVKKNNDTIQIALYQIDSRQPKITSIRNTGTITQLRLNKELVNYTLTSPQKAKIQHTFGANQSEITIYNNLPLNDSIPLTIQATDSLALIVDTTFYVKHIETKLPKEKFTMRVLEPTFDPETSTVTAKALFNKPLHLLNYDSIYFSPDPIPERAPKPKPGEKTKVKKSETPLDSLPKKDTVARKPILKIPITISDITIDSITKTLTLKKAIDKKILTEKVKQLNLAIETAFAISIEQDSTKRELKTIAIPNAESTGILLIEINTKYKNYEVQLQTANGTIVHTVRNIKKHTFKYLPPQEYKLMIYADMNNNGQWDAQNIYQRQLQEPNLFYKTQDGKYTFPVRSAWELGPLLLKF